MGKCPNCSGENSETQRFCGECGTPLPADPRASGERGLFPEAGPEREPGAGRTVSYGESFQERRPDPAGLHSGTVFAGRYLVIEELGAGGMGRVFRVLDSKLDEEIALKLIRSDVAADRRILERFSSELKLARRVVHRNVARMFDLYEEAHEPFITMEYVRGENLKRLIRKVDRLDQRQAVPIARQICEGLAEAHRLGIVHRDLKPQNVMIDEDGQAKIMDFGLASLLTPEGGGGGPSGGGTPAYAAPEQILGQPADGRTDLYALGVVMYEMLTGRTPFKAATVEGIVESQLHETPRDPRELNPEVSAELSRVVMKSLEKDPGLRYQSATELREDLDRLADGPSRRRWAVRIAAGAGALAVAAAAVLLSVRPPESWKRSLAVLPVEDAGLGPEPVNPTFLAGLQREIGDRLSGIPSLRVLPPFSVNSFDLGGKSTPQIGKTLGVRHLLKVTLDIDGDMVNAKFHLFDARKNVNPTPWTFSKALSSYRDLQDEIAITTAKALGVELAPERLTKFSRRGTDNIQAYSLFLEGMTLLEEGAGGEGVPKAIKLLSRAVEIDPGYALGHWGLGYAYENFYFSWDETKDPASLESMYEHLNRASQLDPSFAETNLGLGWYHFNKGDNARAFDSFRKALALEPDGYIVNRDAGAFLRSIGLHEPAIRYLSRAAKLSPRHPQPLTQIAQCWFFLGQCEKALRYTRKALALRENDPDSCFLHTLLLVVTGRYDEADSHITAVGRFELNERRLRFLREFAAAARGGRETLRAFANGQPMTSPHSTYVLLSAGLKDEALAGIQAGIARGFTGGMYYYSYPSLVKNPRYRALSGDPRFREILKRQKELYDRQLEAFEKL